MIRLIKFSGHPADRKAGWLFTLLLSSLLSTSAPLARADQTSFRAQDGEIDASDSVIAAGSFGARRDTISGWRNWYTASASDESALSASDNWRYRTYDPGSGDNAAMIFEYTFDDDANSISEVDLQIEVAQSYADDAIFVYLWDYDAGRYDVLGQMTGTSDRLLSYSITSNAGRYLDDATGQLTVFAVNQDSYGSWASIHVDYIDVAVTSNSPHFSLSHSGTASTCDTTTITLSKHLDTHAVETSYVGTVQIATSTGEGTWSIETGDGTLTDLGGGAATYAYAAADNGVAALRLLHSTSGTVSFTATDGTHAAKSTENLPIVVSGPGANTVADSFSSYSYAGSTGSAPWSNPWIEVGESNGVYSTNASISSGRCVSGYCLRLGTGFSWRETFSGRGVYREVDLDGASAATLRFSYLRGYSRGSGTATLAVSSNGGSTFTTLATYSLKGNTTTPISQAFDLTPHISSETQIRFLISVNSAITSIYLDNIEIEYETSCPATGNFIVSHDGNGSYCQNEPVSVTAKSSNGSTNTTFGGEITLDTQSGTGTWALASGAGSFADTVADDGIATYTYSTSDAGVASFTLAYASGTSSIDVDAYSASARDDDSEGALVFQPGGFVVTRSAIPSPAPLTVNDPIGHQIAGQAFVLHISAFESACGLTDSYTGDKSIALWAELTNPTTGSRVPLIENSAIGTSQGSATTQTIAFTNGRASVTAKYKDVGQLIIHALDASSSPAIQGSTGAFVSRPANFVVTEVKDPLGNDNPGTTLPTGDLFVRAGEAFRATVEARDAENALVPNYGRETPAEGIRLFSSQLVAPVGGRNGPLDDGAITNATAFTAGAPPGTFSGSSFAFDEVGAIELKAGVGDGDYLGAGDTTSSASTTVGRFAPSRFEITSNLPSFRTACGIGAFTWLGQPFHYASGAETQLAVRAVNAAGGTTANYAGSWWKLTNDSLANRSYAVGGMSVDSSRLPDTAVDPAIAENGDGTGTLTFSSGGGLIIERTTPVAPFDAEVALSIDVVDTDSTAYASNPYTVGGTTSGAGIAFSAGSRFLYGRLRVDNAHGSELVDLPVSSRAQHFDGDVFIDDNDDSCSQIDVAHLGLTRTPIALGTSATITHTPLFAGASGLEFSAPNAQGTVDLEVDLGPSGANLPWLQFDWPSDGNLDGNLDDNPSARITFGIWEGRDQVIFIRESY